MPDISGKKIAILATDGFEQSELEVPQKTLREGQAIADNLRDDRVLVLAPEPAPDLVQRFREFRRACHRYRRMKSGPGMRMVMIVLGGAPNPPTS